MHSLIEGVLVSATCESRAGVERECSVDIQTWGERKVMGVGIYEHA